MSENNLHAPKSLVIIEPDPSGHRMQYVRRIVREARRQGVRVRLATSANGMAHPVYQTIVEEEGGLDTLPIEFPVPSYFERLLSSDLLRLQSLYYRMVKSFYRALPPEERDTTFFLPSLNSCDKATAIFGSPFGKSPWGGLIMREVFHHASMGIESPRRRSNGPKETFFLRLLRQPHLRRVFTIDEALAEYVEQRYPSLAPRVSHVPEPVEMRGDVERTEARAAYGIPDDRIVILVYGLLDLRKRLDTLIEALVDPSVPSNVVLLAAGPQSPETRELLAGPAAQALKGRIYERDAFLMDRDEYAAYRAADVVWLGYRAHYTMSAVLVQAGVMGVPVLASREGLIGWVTQRYGHGTTVDAGDSADVRRGLLQFLANPEARSEMADKGRALAEGHAAENFARKILAGLA